KVKRLNDKVLARLREIAGADRVLTSDDERCRHSSDATRRSAMPDAVVCPEDVEQISGVARLCTEERIPLTPRGAGTGLSGGAVPLKGGVVLSLTGLCRIRQVVPEDLYAVVEAGTVTEGLQKAVEIPSLFYPPDPASRSTCPIGGNVATSAGGLRSLKYGTTKRYLLGLEVVLPTGEVMKTGATTVKSVAGFDMTRLVCGSQGTLAIVTAAILRLLPLPEHRVAIVAGFDTLDGAAAACANVTASGAAPSMLEIMDSLAVEAVLGNMALALGHDTPVGVAGTSLVLAETDGFEKVAEGEADGIERVFRDAGARFTRRISEPEKSEELWTARRHTLPALARLRPVTIVEQVTVPRSRVVEMVKALGGIAKKQAIEMAIFGHAGDGKLHVAVLAESLAVENSSRIDAIVSGIRESAVSLGGVLSGEHGIGAEGVGFLRAEMGEAALETAKRLKAAFDPEGILNPGKLFV
ncbi:MAG: FAD-linked oxidase C-terminal domain-containing protein, partial [Candidatus Eisenbacteria bacterium]